MKQLLELARANPGKYNYGHSGVGGPNHLAFEMMKQMEEVDIPDIAYRGTGAVIPAALSNEVGIMIAYLPCSMPHIRSGAYRPFAERRRGVEGKSVSVRVELGGRGFITNTTTIH